MEQLKWVKGNTLSLAVSLVVKTGDGQTIVTTDYVPPTGSEIHVNLVGSYKSFSYDYTIDENVVSFVDDGSLPLGTYGVEITVKEPDARNLRTFKCQEIKIVNCSDELGEVMPDGQIMLDAAIFVQGKKGDPFTYDDFTPEQIADLKKPATDAAADVRLLESQVEQAERGRVDAERLRVQAESGRVEADGIRQEHEQTRQSQEQAREQAEALRVKAEQYREETFATYQPQIDAKLDVVTDSQFDEIFT